MSVGNRLFSGNAAQSARLSISSYIPQRPRLPLLLLFTHFLLTVRFAELIRDCRTDYGFLTRKWTPRYPTDGYHFPIDWALLQSALPECGNQIRKTVYATLAGSDE